MTPKQLAVLHAKSFTLPRPWSEQEFADLLDSDTVFLCSSDHGFALGRVAGPEVELLTITVDPGYRRLGIAKDLMCSFEMQAKAKGAQEAFLEVAETNRPAIALYHSFGFVDAGRRKDYYAGPLGAHITALVLSKVL